MTPWHTGLMDPPWWESGGGKRGAQNHYPLLKTYYMPQVIYQSGLWTPYTSAHLYMWVTNNFLPDGLWLIDALGFEYKTTIEAGDGEEPPDGWVNVWVKERAGLGQYARGQHELLLFGTRKGGKGYEVRTSAKDITSTCFARKGKHSEKPGSYYDLIERRSGGPYVEFFARNDRPGWQSWGNHFWEDWMSDAAERVFLAHPLEVDEGQVEHWRAALNAVLLDAGKQPGAFEVVTGRADWDARFAMCSRNWDVWASRVTEPVMGEPRFNLIIVPAAVGDGVGRATAEIVKTALLRSVPVLAWDGSARFTRGVTFRPVAAIDDWDPDQWKIGWRLR